MATLENDLPYSAETTFREDLPLKVGDAVYVISPVCDKWMQTTVSKLVHRVGMVTGANPKKNVCIGFEVAHRRGIFLFEDVMGGKSNVGSWLPLDPNGAQLSLMWKRLLGFDKLHAMATAMKDLLGNGRSHSDVVSDLLCLLPSLREVQLYPTTLNIQLETE